MLRENEQDYILAKNLKLKIQTKIYFSSTQVYLEGMNYCHSFIAIII